MDQFIDLSFEALEKRLDDTTVLSALLVREIINQEQYEEVRDLSKQAKRRELLGYLRSAEDHCMDKFIDIVEEKTRGKPDLIRHLKENRDKVRRGMQPQATAVRPTLLSLVGDTNLEQQPAPPAGANLSVASSSIPAVEPWLQWEYPKYPSTKGHVLIINNIRNTDDIFATNTREGAHVDTGRLYKLFQNFGMKVYVLPDATVQTFQPALDEFKALFVSDPADVCILVVMGHGTHGDFIYLSDHHPVEIHSHILQQFNNVKFESMRDKAKLFFFQSCRGGGRDPGVVIPAQADAHAITTRTERVPSWGDMLVCYSTIEGNVAWRHPYLGSWFIDIMCDVFPVCATRLDVCRMLNIVAEKMKKMETKNGEKQICTWSNIGFTKDFYFVPGQAP